MSIDTKINIQNSRESILEQISDRTSLLYTPPAKNINLPAIGAQVNLHGTQNTNTLYGGSIKINGTNERVIRLNSYESAMADLYAENLGLQRTDLKKR